MTTKRTFAPALSAHLRYCYCRHAEEDQAAGRELRALRDVARAAAKRNRRDRICNCFGSECEMHALDRALERLDSVSGGRAAGVEGNRKLPANSRRGRAAGARKGKR